MTATTSRPWLQAGRWRLRCPVCPEVAQASRRVDVYDVLDEHTRAAHDVSGLGA